MPTACLSAIADAECEKLAFPLKIRPGKAAKRRLHFGKTGQARQKISRTAEHAFEVFRRVGGDVRAKTARGHIQEHLTIHFAQIDRLRRYIQQAQRSQWLERNTR